MIEITLPYYLTFIINTDDNNSECLISIDNIYNRIRKRFPDVIILTPIVSKDNLLIPIIYLIENKFTNLSYNEQIIFKYQIDYINSYLLTYKDYINIDLYNPYLLQINFNSYVYGIDSKYYIDYINYLKNWIIEYDKKLINKYNYNKIFLPPIITNKLEIIEDIPMPVFNSNIVKIKEEDIPMPIFNKLK
jgi:hypothetical protein